MVDKSEFDFRDKPIRELRGAMKSFTQISQTDAFRWWKAVMEAQAHTRLQSLYVPLDSMDQVPQQEFQKGELQAFTFGVGLWDLLNSELEAAIQRRLDDMTPEEREKEEGRED